MADFWYDDSNKIRMGRVMALVVGGVGGLIFLAALFSGVYSIPAGHVGVITKFGAIYGPTSEPGLHWKAPFITRVREFEVRVQKEQTEAGAASKDLQAVHSTIAVNFHIDSKKAQDLFNELGPDYKIRVIDPAVQEVFKSSTAGYPVEELITKREEVKSHAYNLLKERLVKYHIVVDDLNIVNFDFSKDFNNAIEAKQVAQQQVQKAQQELARAKVDAETAITAAHAAAEAQRLQQQTLTPLIIQLEWLRKWDGKLPQYMTDMQGLFSLPAPK